MSGYAKGTTVPSEKSRYEIERTLTRFGADQFMYGWEDGRAVVQFRAVGRLVRFVLPIPDRDSREFTHTPSKGIKRSADAAAKAYEAGVRERWRALALVIKAKLVAVEDGIVEFEQEFLAHIVLPSGETVGTWIAPGLAAAYESGSMPALPGGSNE